MSCTAASAAAALPGENSYAPDTAIGGSIAGGATAVVLYYVIGAAIFATYIWSGRGVLKPSLKPPMLSWPPLRDTRKPVVGSGAST